MTKPPKLMQWAALAAAGGASFYGANYLSAPDSAVDSAEPVVWTASARTVTVAADAETPRPVAPPARALIDTGTAAETFRGMSWTPPPPSAPPPAPPAPPPPPTAPPLPFRFVGLLEQQSDQPTAFLAKGEALHVVRVGDEIDGAYRIESLSPSQVVITYLPLKQKQTLGVDGGER